MKFIIIGFLRGKEVTRFTVFAASATRQVVMLNALSMLLDAGFECDSAQVEVAT